MTETTSPSDNDPSPGTSPRIALITGANKGIGLAIARQLGADGYAVWLGCRDLQRGDVAAQGLRDAGIDARAVQLDVTNDASVADAAARIAVGAGKLDVLVNNAGIMFRRSHSVAEESIDEIRLTFETNVFGALRVTQAFLPLLRRSGAARIIMMSSGLGSIQDAVDVESETWHVGFGGYCASKAALNMMTIKLAKELSHEKIEVNAVDPGLTSTDMTDGRGHSSEQGAYPAVILATKPAPKSAVGLYTCSADGALKQKRW